MLTTLKNAFKIKEIRLKLLYTLMMLVIIRLGCELPVPGVNREYFAQWYTNQVGATSGLVDMFTGGSFMNMSVFALNITPYITSSIIMQLMTIAIPKLEEMQREGEEGRKKIASITRYVTVGLALIESTAMAIGFSRSNLLQNGGALDIITVIVTLTAGSAVLMWFGEQITEKGVGNGISIVLTINILSRIPQDMKSLYQQFVENKSIGVGVVAAVVIIAIIIGMVVLVIYLNDGERKIPVQYAKKMQGRKMIGGQSTHIPLKINTAGVIPIIFASSIMEFPQVIVSLFNINLNEFWGEFFKYLSSNQWCKFSRGNIKYSIGLLVYIAMVIAFAYFYTSITFNPLEVADNMKKNGGFIPGIRPGRPTSDYLTKILNYIIFIGACGLTLIGVLPFFFNGAFGASVSFGGTSLIIIVSVILETIKQVESQMLVRNYKGFLND
ncbi:MAG: preprotein translocase subunit SecY [Lachnospiraceae bacterium]|nr:preprotein translocase subunit SecY [Lachnospiraceae bacterium]